MRLWNGIKQRRLFFLKIVFYGILYRDNKHTAILHYILLLFYRETKQMLAAFKSGARAIASAATEFFIFHSIEAKLWNRDV